MSIEAAKLFIERMKDDEDFRKKVVECKDAEGRKALVVKEGFEFSKEEITKIKNELSDEQLKSVCGGQGSEGCTLMDFCTLEGFKCIRPSGPAMK